MKERKEEKENDKSYKPWKIIFVLIIFYSEVVMVWTGFQGFAVLHKRIIHIHAPL